MTILSAALMLFLVMDPIGNIPNFLSVLKEVEPDRKTKIIFREMVIALVILMLFLFGGRLLMQVLGIREPALSLAGGIILFLIALRMIFPPREGVFGTGPEGEPLIVPMAIHLIAGPSALSTVLVIVNRDPQRWPQWLAALGCAWLVSGIILVAANPLSQLLGKKVITALEKVMGMLLTVIAVQMFINGLAKIGMIR